jgi:hypothetical protein
MTAGRLRPEHNLAIDHRLIREGSESLRDARIPEGEILIIPGRQVDFFVGLEGNRAVAVKLEFKKPLRPTGKLLDAEEQA